ncbi:MAG: hypothetical protein N7Q72_05850, partial [Spiroplasma sp. Tabriz.8]|nr:hypothetical protein [Spiroplasma sp. Tabriz.8]
IFWLSARNFFFPIPIYQTSKQYEKIKNKKKWERRDWERKRERERERERERRERKRERGRETFVLFFLYLIF